jgi:hypothetical protein
MFSDGAAHCFELPARVIGFLQFKKRDSQWKSRAHHQLRVELQCGSKFVHGGIIPVLPKGFVAFSEVNIRRILAGRSAKHQDCERCGELQKSPKVSQAPIIYDTHLSLDKILLGSHRSVGRTSRCPGAAES